MVVLDGHALLYAAAALLLAAALASALRTPVIRRHGVPLRKPPGTLPLVGNGIVFLEARQKLFAWFVRCQRRFGLETVQIAVPTLPPGVVLHDPRNLDFVLRNEGSLVRKGAFVQGMLWDLFGHGIVNADGDMWRVQRKAGLAFLGVGNTRVLTDVALPRQLADTLALLRGRAAAAAPVDLQAVFHELTSRLMGKMAYNMEMHADDDFTLAFDYASAATTERFQNPLWFVTEALTGTARLRRALAVVKAFGRRIVATAVADLDASRSKSSLSSLSTAAAASTDHVDATAADTQIDEVSGSLIQSLLAAISDQDVVADAALNYLSAGRDTVAQGLTWTFYMLMRNPRVVDQIHLDVRRALSFLDPDAPDAPDALRPHLARLTPAALPYTMAVFYEGLRLFPPIPFEIKQVEADLLTLPDGTELPRGALIVWCSWALNRSRLTWGDDADDFRPERWLVAVDSPSNTSPPYRLVSRSPSEFPVFHGGPRTCLGKKLAEAMAVQILAAVVWSFDFDEADDRGNAFEPNADPRHRPDRVTKTSLTLPMQGGLPCFVRARGRRCTDA